MCEVSDDGVGVKVGLGEITAEGWCVDIREVEEEV